MKTTNKTIRRCGMLSAALCTAILCGATTTVQAQTTITWSLTNLIDENDQRPEAGQFVGYFVPLADTTGTLRTFENGLDYSSAKEEFVLWLKRAGLVDIRDYLYGESFNTVRAGRATFTGNFSDEFPNIPGTIAGFAVVFNSSSIWTSTHFVVTDVLVKETDETGTTPLSFVFGSQAGAEWQPMEGGYFATQDGYTWRYRTGVWVNDSDPEGGEDDEISIVGVWPMPTGDFVIPSELDGKTVAALGGDSFNGAFAECAGLTSVTIPSSIRLVMRFIFDGCSNITNLVFLEGEETEYLVFYGPIGRMEKLTSIYLPARASLWAGIFCECPALTSYSVSDESEWYSVCNRLLLDKSGKNLIACPAGLTEVTIPASVISIEEESFYGSHATNIVFLGNAPTSIEAHFFSDISTNCVAYVSRSSTGWGVEIPGMWQGMRIEYFDEEPEPPAPEVHAVTFNLVAHGTRTGGGELVQAVTNGCTAIAPTVAAEQGWEFSGWDGDVSAAIVGNTIFTAQYSQLSVWSGSEVVDGIAWKFVISNGVAEVRGDAVTNEWEYGILGEGRFTTAIPASTAGAISIPSTLGGCPVTNIGHGAFHYCQDLTSVAIPEGVTNIGDFAFLACESLASIAMPDSLTSIGGHAFEGCGNLTSVTIPGSVTDIEWFAFACCASLTDVTFEGDAPSMGEYVFDGVASNCTAYVSHSSTGWGVEIPGTWQGMRIEYFDGEPEPPQAAAFSVENDVESMEIIDGDWDGNGTSSNGYVRFYINVSTFPEPETVERLREALGNGSAQLRVLAKRDTSDAPWAEVRNAIQLYGIANSSWNPENIEITFYEDEGYRFFKVVLTDEEEASIESDNVAMLVVGRASWEIRGEITIGADFSEFGLTAPAVVVDDWLTEDLYYGPFNHSPICVSPGDIVEFHYDLGILRDYHSFDYNYFAVLVDRDMGTALVVEPYGLGYFYDIAPNIGTFRWQANVPQGRYAIGFLPEEMLPDEFYDGEDWDEYWADWWEIGKLEDMSSLLFILVDVGETEPVPPTPEVHAVTFDLGAHGTRTGGGELVQSVTNGCAAVAPTVAADQGWEFIGWDGDVSAPIVGNTTFTAQYSQLSVWSGSEVIDGITWKFTISNGKAIVVRNGNYSGEVTIPSTLGGYPVTGIGDGAFRACDLTSVTIPDSVTNIGDRAFQACRSLTNATIPNGITSIASEVFDRCHSLTNVVIPNGITNIGYKAFYGCQSLSSITIPDGVTSIGHDAFDSCYGLFDTNSIPGVILVDGWVVGYNSGLSGDIDLSGIRGIGEYAFEDCSSLTSIIIPDGVTIIGAGVFYRCSSLASVTIPDSVTCIGEVAFYYCSSLATVTIPASVASIGERALMCGGRGLNSFIFVGNAPELLGYEVFNHWTNNVAYVSRLSTGWGVEIPGTWNGIRIEYFDDEPPQVIVRSPLPCVEGYSYPVVAEGPEPFDIEVSLSRPVEDPVTVVVENHSLASAIIAVESGELVAAPGYEWDEDALKYWANAVMTFAPFDTGPHKVSIVPYQFEEGAGCYVHFETDYEVLMYQCEDDFGINPDYRFFITNVPPSLVTSSMTFNDDGDWVVTGLQAGVRGEFTVRASDPRGDYSGNYGHIEARLYAVEDEEGLADLIRETGDLKLAANGVREIDWGYADEEGNLTFSLYYDSHGTYPIVLELTELGARENQFIHYVGYAVVTSPTETIIGGITNYWLEVTQPEKGGSINCESGWHPLDDMFMVQASVSSGYRFAGWTGDVDGLYRPAENRIAIVMDRPRSIGAEFEAIQYPITYAETRGAANPNPATYTVEDSLTFAPLPDVEGWVFTGWSPAGIAVGSTGAVTATAHWARADVSVTVDGETTTHHYGDAVEFAAPEPWETNWTQIVTLGTAFTAPVVTNHFSVTLTNDIAFDWDILATNWWLSVEAPDNGTVYVDGLDGGSAPVPAPVAEWVADGTAIWLAPVPAANHHFVAWTGDTAGCIESNVFLLVAMDRPRDIGATFAIDIVSVIDDVSPAAPTEDDAIILQGHAEGAAPAEYLWRAVSLPNGAASVLGRSQVCRTTLPEGDWRIEFLAKDAAGNWSAAATTNLAVGASRAMPDLQVARADISFIDTLGLSTSNMQTGDVVAVRAAIQNRGAVRFANGAAVYLCDGIVPVEDLAALDVSDGRILAVGEIPALGAGRSQTIELEWRVGFDAAGNPLAYEDGPNAFTLATVPLDGIDADANAGNNLASMMLEFGETGETLSDLLRVSASAPSQVWEGESYAVSGSVWYQRDGAKAMMAGASVVITIDGETVAETVTGADGRYTCAFSAPEAGVHAYAVKAADGAAVKTASGSFTSRAREEGGGESGESGEAGGDNEIPVLRGPNLVVTSISITGNGITRNASSSYSGITGAEALLSAIIANMGDVAVSNDFEVALRLENQSGAGTALDTVRTVSVRLAPGESVRVTASGALTLDAAGSWKATATVDSAAAVAEWYETDNTLRAWLSVEDPMPNLEVTGLSLSSSGLVEGDEATVTVTVCNTGTAATTNVFAVSFDDGVTNSVAFVDGLVAGATATLQFAFTAVSPSMRLVAKADAGNAVAESDESDNSHSLQIAVCAAEADVKPVSLTASPYPAAGRTCVLTAKFRNNGGAAFLGGEVVFYERLADGTFATIATASLGAIAWKGGTGTATAAWTPVGGGDHVVVVALAGADLADVSQSYSVTFRQSAPPDLRVTPEDISFEPGTPSAGDAVRFRAMVRNLSTTAAATNVAVAFSITAGDGAPRALTTMSVAYLAPGGSEAVDADVMFPVERGIYTIGVAVSDGTGRDANAADNSASRTFGVSVPVAVASAPATGIAGDAITLDGSGSANAERFAWSLAEAPAGCAAEISNAVAAVASFTPPLAGTYRFSLVVSDGVSESAPAECEVAIDRVRITAAEADGGAVEPSGSAIYPAGAVVEYRAVPAEHYHFVAWTGDTEGCVETNAILLVATDRSRTIGAVFALDAITAGEAANAPDLDWSSSGAAEWIGCWTDAAADGIHAARSGAIGDNAESVLAVTLSGPGDLSFDWRASCEERYDALRLVVDGNPLRTVSGETDWTHVEITLGDGEHEVRWVYRKGRSNSAGEDAVWLDNVVWAAAASTEPAAPPTLAEALGDFSWTTSGDVEWTAIRGGLAYDGGSYAAAAGLGDLETATLRTTVRGSGRLSFRWAISCEDGYDWFEFVVDGEVLETTTGETGWEAVTVELGAGSHVLEWVYWKDVLDDEGLVGSNRAMLDFVQWVSDGNEPEEPDEPDNPAEMGGETLDEFCAWLKKHNQLSAGETSDDALALYRAGATAASSTKGMTLFDEFVAGTDPNNPDDKFTADIAFKDGRIVVTPRPDLGDARVYRMLGKRSLSDDEQWDEVRDGEEGDYRFFKVSVELP